MPSIYKYVYIYIHTYIVIHTYIHTYIHTLVQRNNLGKFYRFVNNKLSSHVNTPPINDMHGNPVSS